MIETHKGFYYMGDPITQPQANMVMLVHTVNRAKKFTKGGSSYTY